MGEVEYQQPTRTASLLLYEVALGGYYHVYRPEDGVGVRSAVEGMLGEATPFDPGEAPETDNYWEDKIVYQGCSIRGIGRYLPDGTMVAYLFHDDGTVETIRPEDLAPEKRKLMGLE